MQPDLVQGLCFKGLGFQGLGTPNVTSLRAAIASTQPSQRVERWAVSMCGVNVISFSAAISAFEKVGQCQRVTCVM
eukprot:1546953-Karenia_brevis.AAC.1